MKIFALAVMVIFFASCGNPKDNAPLNMPGAYNMLLQSFKGAAIDTTFTQHRQLKIYTGDYMMYVRVNPADSVSAFGVGTWSVDSGKLTENIFYSATDTAENTNTFSGTVNITKKDSGYEQVIPEIMSDKGKIRLTEEYQSVGTAAKSPLDGVWQQVSGYTVKGKDTAVWNDVQYKAFYAGNFVYGNVAETMPGKKHTYISYGTFAMTGDYHLKETITAATSSALQGRYFDLDIAMKGTDEFTQTATEKNGDKEFITYQKLKKK